MTLISLARMRPSFLKPILTLIFMKTRGRQPARNSSSRVLINLTGLRGFLCQHRGNQSVVVVAGFAAEAAADSALDDPHVGLGHAQRRGDSIARVEQRLSVHVDRVFAAGGVFGDAADGFDRAVPLRHARKGVFDDDVGFGEGLGDVAALEVQVHGDIVRLVVVHQRRRRLSSPPRHRRQPEAVPNRPRSSRWLLRRYRDRWLPLRRLPRRHSGFCRRKEYIDRRRTRPTGA